jgi:hypothetical protein
LGRESTPILLRSNIGLTFVCRSYTALVGRQERRGKFIAPLEGHRRFDQFANHGTSKARCGTRQTDLQLLQNV